MTTQANRLASRKLRDANMGLTSVGKIFVGKDIGGIAGEL
jgi:hypothetical protein